MPAPLQNQAALDEVARIKASLFAPFTIAEMKLRPGNKMGVGKHSKTGTGQFRVFAYADKRALMDRLDNTLGPLNWSIHYEPLGGEFICQLKLRINGEWYVKEGVGGPHPSMQSDQDKAKSAATDAFRRAANAWGLAAHIERLPQIVWEGEINDKGQFRRWVQEPVLRKHYALYLAKQAEGAVFQPGDIIWPPRNLSSRSDDADDDDAAGEASPPAQTRPRSVAPAQSQQRPQATPAAHTQSAPQPTAPAAAGEAIQPSREQQVFGLAKTVTYDAEQGRYAVGPSGSVVYVSRPDPNEPVHCTCKQLASLRAQEPDAACVHILAVAQRARQQKAAQQ